MGEEFSFAFLLAGAVSIVTIVCFFYLCKNVSKIKKSIISDLDEFLIAKKMGDKEKAYYHLCRSYFLEETKLTDESAMGYYNEFKNIGKGIPNSKKLQDIFEADTKK